MFKAFHDAERAKGRILMAEGGPRGMQHSLYREFKRLKRSFRNALDASHDQYMLETNRDIDEAAENIFVRHSLTSILASDKAQAMQMSHIP